MLVKHAAEAPYSVSVGREASNWRCLVIQLDKVGSATISLLSLVRFYLVC